MSQQTADIVFRNGKVTTLDKKQRDATAIAVRNDRILKVGTDSEIMALKGPATREVDLKKRRVVPGLTDGHIHVIRGGLSYNMELRWDGVDSLAVAMEMLKKQVQNTPPPQWVRVVGGFTEHQFREKRLPTLAEINQAAPETPVFILHLYDRALLNRAAIRVCGFTKDTPDFPGGIFERDSNGNPTGLLLAHPNATILYSTLAKGPKLPREYQVNSTLHFMRELNRLGLTGVIDAGGGSQRYPEDYDVITELSKEGKLTLRFAYNLFTQKPKGEFEDFSNWCKTLKPGHGEDLFKLNGAGEMLVYSAADFEDFRVERPEMPANMEAELERVVRVLVENRWPFRLHATYDETIGRALDVYEKVNRDIPFNGIHWFFDHAETISSRNIDRVKALGGGIAIQNRMAFQGEYFVERYGAAAARRSPPIQEFLSAGIPVGAGTDATRVASYNPWVSLYWLVTGKTVGGLKLYPDENCVDRSTALSLWTEANAWFSNEEGARGQIAANQFADFIALSDDYFSIDAEEIKNITSVLTVVAGKVVHGSDEFASLSPPLPPVMPDWSPVKEFGGYQHRHVQRPGYAAREQHAHPEHFGCGLHQTAKRFRSSIEEAVLDWSFDCQCWGF
ncbi:MAG: amidohydrolase [Oligoflexia bacterium]|nr:amidohydrolase [Oligoflexia bacterium]